MEEFSEIDGILTNSRIFRQFESERVKLISDRNEMKWNETCDEERSITNGQTEINGMNQETNVNNATNCDQTQYAEFAECERV